MVNYDNIIQWGINQNELSDYFGSSRIRYYIITPRYISGYVPIDSNDAVGKSNQSESVVLPTYLFITILLSFL